MKKARQPEILIASDDVTFAERISAILGEHDLAGAVMAPRQATRQALARRNFDILIIAIVVDTAAGAILCGSVRNDSDKPIILFLPPERHLDGIEAGADYCLPPECEPRHLMTHVRALLRRSVPSIGKSSRKLKFDGFRIDADRRQLHAPDGSLIRLHGAEFELLHAFCRQPGAVLSRSALLDATHLGIGKPLERSIDVHICRLRRRLSQAQANAGELIQTVRLGGYVFISRINPE